MPFFEVTYADGSVEEIEADDCREMGRHLTFVNYRIRACPSRDYTSTGRVPFAQRSPTPRLICKRTP